MTVALALILAVVPAEPVRARPAVQRRARAVTRPKTIAGAGTAVDAERAFAADAKALGQWTAFRKWAAPDAIMFLPQPVAAADFLRGRTDPPAAIGWAAAESFVSCDGTMAVNVGYSRPAPGRHGSFLTVWRKQADGAWRWAVDSGGDIPAAPVVLATPVVRRASCEGEAPFFIMQKPLSGWSGDRQSKDGTLRWVASVERDGTLRYEVTLWTGRGFELVKNAVVGVTGGAAP